MVYSAPFLSRVNLIKMTILTKFRYLFQHILLILNTFFAKIDKSISHFLWGNKSVRMRNNILQLPTDFLHYYWAVNIQKLLSDEGTANQPAWVQVEFSSSQTSLRSLLCSQLPVPATNISVNPVVIQSLKIWMQCRKHFNLQRSSIHAQVSHNHNFKPSIMDSAFQLWSDRGIISIKEPL